jgi:hypothetical protein
MDHPKKGGADYVCMCTFYLPARPFCQRISRNGQAELRVFTIICALHLSNLPSPRLLKRGTGPISSQGEAASTRHWTSKENYSRTRLFLVFVNFALNFVLNFFALIIFALNFQCFVLEWMKEACCSKVIFIVNHTQNNNNNNNNTLAASHTYLFK